MSFLQVLEKVPFSFLQKLNLSFQVPVPFFLFEKFIRVMPNTVHLASNDWHFLLLSFDLLTKLKLFFFKCFQFVFEFFVFEH